MLLASLYEKGDGLEKDMMKATEFYEKACDLGDVTTSLVFGAMFEE